MEQARLADAARQLFADGKYHECGKRFTELSEIDPGSPHNDTWLYNAVICHRSARDVNRAIATSRQMLATYPDSPLAGNTLHRLAALSEALGRFRIAAERHEQFVRRHGGAPEAWDAASTAVVLRWGLGDRREAARNLQLMERLFARKRPRELARAVLMAALHHEKSGDDRALIKALRRYLKRFGSRGSMASRVRALSALAQAEWRSSCKRPTADGTCATLEVIPDTSQRARPTHCDRGGTLRRPVKRTRSLVKQARAHFNQILKLTGGESRARGGATGVASMTGVASADMIDQQQLREARASALFHLAQSDYEAFLGRSFPRGLNFTAERRRSTKRFTAWIDQQRRATSQLRDRYTDIMSLKTPRWAIAAAMRVGDTTRHLGDQLRLSPIPADIRKGELARDKINAYCQVLAEQVQPLSELSNQAFEFCAGTSLRLNYFDDSTLRCRAMMADVRPRKYAPTRELFAAPTSVDGLDWAQGKGVAHWRARSEASPGDRDILLALASALLRAREGAADADVRVKLTARANAVLDSVMVLDPADIRVHVLFAVLHMQPEHPAHLTTGKLFLDQGRRIDGGSAQLWNNLGVWHAHQGQWQPAHLAFERARRADRDHLRARLNAGRLAVVTHDFERAHEHLSAVRDKRPISYDDTVALGVALRGLERYDDARAAYLAATRLDGKRGEAWFNLGILARYFIAPGARTRADEVAALRQAAAMFERYAALDQVSSVHKARARQFIDEIRSEVAPAP